MAFKPVLGELNGGLVAIFLLSGGLVIGLVIVGGGLNPILSSFMFAAYAFLIVMLVVRRKLTGKPQPPESKGLFIVLRRRRVRALIATCTAAIMMMIAIAAGLTGIWVALFSVGAAIVGYRVFSILGRLDP